MQQTIINTQGSRIGKLITRSQRVEMILTDGDLFKMDGDNRRTSISCLEGRLWVTQQGDSNDYLLLAGQSMMIGRSGSVLIQGQPDARFALRQPMSGLN